MPDHEALPAERILRVAESLAGAPRVLQGLEEVLRRPNADLEQVADLIRRDGALTARTIRVANSATFSRGGERTGSLEEALGRVGFGEVYRLASVAAFMQVAERPLHYYGTDLRALREHALLCALLAERLAPLVALEPRGAYTTGLLNAVGRVVLDATAWTEGRKPSGRLAGDGNLIEWELRQFGRTSAEVGALVLKAWYFPAEALVAVRDQWLDGLAVDPLPGAKLLHVALAEAEGAGVSLPGTRPITDRHAAAARIALGLTAAGIAEARRLALQAFQRLKDVLD